MHAMSAGETGFRWPVAARSVLARVGARAVTALGVIGIIAWTFVGSLVMGLRTPRTSEARMVWLWLVGLALIVVLSGLGAWLAGDQRDRWDETARRNPGPGGEDPP